MNTRKTLLAIICGLLVSAISFAQERVQLENGMYLVDNAGRYGLQDDNGNVIVSAEYDTLSFRNGIAVLLQIGHGRFGQIILHQRLEGDALWLRYVPT